MPGIDDLAAEYVVVEAQGHLMIPEGSGEVVVGCWLLVIVWIADVSCDTPPSFLVVGRQSRGRKEPSAVQQSLTTNR